MFTHNINPVLFTLLGLEVRWYGLIYVLGFILGFLWLKRSQLLSSDDLWDLMLYLTLGTIVGARLFLIFWYPQTYLLNPLNLIKFWQGGMSFHGGFTGIIVAGYLFCKIKKINFWKIADILSVPFILALGLGRIANFINGELVGKVSNAKWCVVFPQFDQECRHPSTIYAAIKRFIVFGWVYFLSLKNNFSPGFIFWNFVLWDSVGRLIVDFYRFDQLYYYLSLGQWFSVIMIGISLVYLIKNHIKDIKLIFPYGKK
jgi:phosphatidylglycerol---prolipoprotein diacylglyceryl transferase